MKQYRTQTQYQWPEFKSGIAALAPEAQVEAIKQRTVEIAAERDRLRVTGDRMARAILDYEVGQGRASWDELLAARSAWLALAKQERQASDD